MKIKELIEHISQKYGLNLDDNEIDELMFSCGFKQND